MHCIEDVYVPLFIMVNYLVEILCLFENVYFSKTFSIYYICCRPSVCRHHGFCETTFFLVDWSFWIFTAMAFGIYLRYCSPMISKQEAPRCQIVCFRFYTPAPQRGRGVYCFTSVRPSVCPRYFSSHFSQQLSMAEIWYLVTSFI
jgi:hypothetical protein